MNVIADAKMPHCTSVVSEYVTISLEVKTTIPNSQKDKLAFLDQADRNVYQAKSIGRNRSITAQIQQHEKINST